MPLPEIAIQSQRLELRAVSAADLGDLMEINGDPEVTRFLPYATWNVYSDAEAWLERMSKLSQATGSRQLVLLRNEDKRVVGTVLLFKFDENSKRVELGYVVGRRYWRQGYAREALQALLSHLFSSLEVRRVEAEVNPGNVASTSLLQALGFTHEGHLRERYESKGAVYGVDVYGMLASEWRQTAARPPVESDGHRHAAARG